MKKLRTVLYLFIGAYLLFGCEKEDCISGNGQTTSKTYNISSLTGIEVSSKADVDIVLGDPGLTIEGESNILAVLNVKEQGNTLVIGEDNCFKSMQALKISLSLPELNYISTSGVCDIMCRDTVKSESFSINLSGTSNINLTVDCDEITTISSGDCSVSLKGNTKSHEISISGEADFNCFDLISKSTTIDISGKADIEVYAEDYLDVDISGSGNVYYKGTPSIKQDISGVGKIIDSN